MVTLKIRKASNQPYVPLDINESELETTYRTMDAESLATQCANLTTTLSLPRTANNISILTALFDIRTIYSTATFDIYGKCEAALGINGEETYGFVSLVSAGKTFELSFRSGLSVIMESLEGRNIRDLFTGVTIPFTIASFGNYYNYWRNGGTRNTVSNWNSTKKRWTSNLENFCFVVAPSDNDTTVQSLFTKADSNKVLNLKWGRYNEDGSGYDAVDAALTPLQFNSAKTSDLRMCVKVSYLAQLILESLGYTIDYDTEFFNYKNKYSANIFMALAKVQGADTTDVATYMPDITQSEFLISFLKLFGLFIVLEDNKITIKLRKNYYDTATIIDADSLVDKDSLVVRPNDYYKPYKGTLESGLDAIDYASAQDTKIQGSVVVNGVVTEDAENILDGSIFKTAPMLRYEEQLSGVWWRNGEARCYITFAGNFDSALFSEGGCELVIPQFAVAGEEGALFTLFEDDIKNPVPEWYFHENGEWQQYAQTPFAVPYTNDISTYPYNGRLFFNFANPKIIPPTEKDGFFISIHQPYINAISDRDAVIIECDAQLTPTIIQVMRKCNVLVKIDNTICRIVQFVVNTLGKAKLTLQKILNPSALNAGQDDFAPYFHTPKTLVFANSAIGLKDTEINSNMDGITGTITGTGGVQSVSSNGKKVSLTSVTLPTFPAYSGADAVPMALQSRITYHAPELQLATIQNVFRIPQNGYADILEGEWNGSLHINVDDSPVTIKSKYFNMPEGWTRIQFTQSGGQDIQPPYLIAVRENGDLVITRQSASAIPYVAVIGFYTGGITDPIFATCEIVINS